jgi:hypothetical protein
MGRLAGLGGGRGCAGGAAFGWKIAELTLGIALDRAWARRI